MSISPGDINTIKSHLIDSEVNYYGRVVASVRLLLADNHRTVAMEINDEEVHQPVVEFSK